MVNYLLHKNTQLILVSAEKEHEVWIMYFDGARCKYSCGDRVIFKPPYGYMKRFSLRLTWTCTKNVVEYEYLYLGLS